MKKLLAAALAITMLLTLCACGAKSAAPADDPNAKKCTVSVSCATIIESGAEIKKEKAEFVPADGWILKPMEATFTEGESALDVVLRVFKENKIQMDFENNPVLGSYFRGIGNIYEGDCGELSYWLYTVNGGFLDVGCGLYTVQEGDEICMLFTCDMGADVGMSMGDME